MADLTLERTVVDRAYPGIQGEAIRAVLAYAAQTLAHEGKIEVPQ